MQITRPGLSKEGTVLLCIFINLLQLGENKMCHDNLTSSFCRYRNFERLHRQLKEIPNYSLHLPPKSFLSSSVDDYLVHQRCILLDKYLQVCFGSLALFPFISKMFITVILCSIGSLVYS